MGDAWKGGRGLCALVWFVVSGAALLGCATEEPGVQSVAIVGGTRDTGDPSVMLLGRFDSNDTLKNGCTCFAISEHVALTTAHCFIDADSSTRFAIFTGSDGRSAVKGPSTSWLHVRTWQVNPEYDGNDPRTNHADIAAVATDEALPGPPIGLPQTALSADLVGQKIRMVGYGETVAGQVSSAFAKYEVTNTVTALDQAFVLTNEPAGYCLGDSGGPELLRVNGTETAIALMDLRGRTDAGRCTGDSHAVRVDRWTQSFVMPFLAANEAPLASADGGADGGEGDDGGACAISSPRTGSVYAGLLLVCAFALTRTRRRL